MIHSPLRVQLVNFPLMKDLAANRSELVQNSDLGWLVGPKGEYLKLRSDHFFPLPPASTIFLTTEMRLALRLPDAELKWSNKRRKIRSHLKSRKLAVKVLS